MSTDQDLSLELARMLNRHSAENESNTPDFQLAKYMLGCLDLFNLCIQARDAWYGMNPEPATDWASRVPEPPRDPAAEREKAT